MIKLSSASICQHLKARWWSRNVQLIPFGINDLSAHLPNLQQFYKAFLIEALLHLTWNMLGVANIDTYMYMIRQGNIM